MFCIQCKAGNDNRLADSPVLVSTYAILCVTIPAASNINTIVFVCFFVVMCILSRNAYGMDGTQLSLFACCSACLVRWMQRKLPVHLDSYAEPPQRCRPVLADRLSRDQGRYRQEPSVASRERHVGDDTRCYQDSNHKHYHRVGAGW